MTYTQWLERYLELSYMGQWVDESWFQRFVALVERTEARLNPADHGENLRQDGVARAWR